MLFALLVMTLLLRSLGHIWVEGSRLFLLWAVKWSRPPCCTAFFRAQYSAQFSSFYTRSLCLISLNVTLSNITCLLLDPSKSSNLPVVLRIGQSDIPVCYSARNLGVMFDSGLTMKQQGDRICQIAYFKIRRIGSIRQFLTTNVCGHKKSCHVSCTASFRLL